MDPLSLLARCAVLAAAPGLLLSSCRAPSAGQRCRVGQSRPDGVRASPEHSNAFSAWGKHLNSSKDLLNQGHAGSCGYLQCARGS